MNPHDAEPTKDSLLVRFEESAETRLAAMDRHALALLSADEGRMRELIHTWARDFMSGIRVQADPAEMHPEAMGERIRRARTLRRMTGTELAVALGYAKGQQYINKIELGRVEGLAFGTIGRIAAVLDVDPGWLAYGSGLPPAGIEGIKVRARIPKAVQA